MPTCKTCKYYAVPLTDEERERRKHTCPGANPLGDPDKKICVLEGREGFQVNPGNCKYYFPVFMRMR